MHVQLLSDIHLDFYRDNTLRSLLLKRLLDPAADVVVVAGDVSNATTLCAHVEDLCAAARDSQVVMVLGNHDFYGCSSAEEHMRMLDRWQKPANLHLLRNSTTTIGGVRFGGTTLWFTEPDLSPKERSKRERGMQDFCAIGDFTPWVYAEHDAALDFVHLVAPHVDVLVTHHLPHARCISPRFAGSPLNIYFNSEAADRVPVLPPYWMFGHTHAAVDLTERGCRFVCNPVGYPSHLEGEVLGFQNRMRLDVSPRSGAGG